MRRSPGQLFRIACLALAICGVPGACMSGEAYRSIAEAKDAARILMENEKYAEAADILAPLQRENPGDKRLLFDTVTALTWSGRSREAADLSNDFVAIRPPKYAVAAAAKAHRQVGSYDIAAALYRDGQARYHNDPDFILGEILTLVDAGRFDSAEEAMKKYRDLYGDTPQLAEAVGYQAQKRRGDDFHRRRDEAVALARSGDYAAALRELEGLKGEYPGEEGIGFDLMAATSWAGRHAEAATLSDALDLDAAPDYVLRAAAVSYREAGRLDRAEALFRRLVAENPHDAEMVESLAVTLLRENRIVDAERVVADYRLRGGAAPLATADGMLLMARRDEAVKLARDGKPAEAAALLERLSRSHPDHVGVKQDLVAVYSWAGRHEDAAKLAESIDLAAAPEYVRRAAAQSYRESGRLPRAEEVYKTLVGKDSTDISAVKGYILSLVGDGKLDEAEDALERYKSSGDPALMADVEGRIVALRRDQAAEIAKQGDFNAALSRLQILKAKRPGYVGVDHDIAAILSWAGHHEEAAEAMGAFDLNSAPQYVRQAAAVSFRESGRLSEAEALYRAMLAKTPDNEVLAEGLALTLVKEGGLDEAEGIIDRFSRPGEKPAGDKYQYVVGVNAMAVAKNALLAARRDRAAALGRKGDFDQALAILSDLVKRNPGVPGLLEDQLAILSWAGKYEEVVAGAEGLDAGRLPEYVVVALASSLRKTGRLERALTQYLRAAERFPANDAIAAGIAMTLFDLGRQADAKKYLAAFKYEHPGGRGADLAAAQRYVDQPTPYAPPPRPDAPYRKRQDDIIAKGRDGKEAEASKEMAALYQEHPDDVYLLGDYITLLQWNKENDKVIELSGRLDLRLAHDYVIGSVAKAYFGKNDHFTAIKYLDQALAAQAVNPDLLMASAALASKYGYVTKSERYLEQAAASRVPGVGNRVRGMSAAIGHDFVEGMRDLEKAMRDEKAGGATAETRRRLVLALTAVRDSQLARSTMRQAPEPEMTPAERRNIGVAAAVRGTAWGEQSGIPQDVEGRVRRLLDAIHALEDLMREPDCAASPECVVDAASVKIKALYDLNQPREAIAEYEAIKDLGVRIPDGTLLSVAGAYLGVRCPAKAKATYLALIARADDKSSPPRKEDLFEARKGLFWALLEHEELRCALAQANAHFRDGAEPGEGKRPLYENDDWRKTDVNLTRGLAYLYTNHMAEAEKQLTQVVADAPGNAGPLAGLASTQAMRGLPRTANENVHLAQILDPSDVGLATQEATNYLNSRDWRKTHKLLKAVTPYRDYVNSVKNLCRDWNVHNMYEFRLDIAYSRVVSGMVPGTVGLGDTPSLEARLFSKPILYDWRAFIGGATTSGDFQEGYARQVMALGGLEFRNPFLTATLEARADRVHDTRLGLGLSGAVTPDDHWRIPFSAEILSRDTPLRARNSGITANSFGTGAQYYWNESRSLNTSATFMDFSDGNRRFIAGGNFNQRLWTCFTRYLDGQINVYGSHNTEDANRPYFNPKDDFELGGALTYGNVLWRCYEKVWRHTVTAGAGNYWQRYYGNSLVFTLGYSQSIDWTPCFSVAYGVGFGRRVYDGDPEYNINAFLSLVYRF